MDNRIEVSVAESGDPVSRAEKRPTTIDLADILKRRGIKTVYYFHTDHYEPWSSTISEKSARAVDRFAKMSRQSRFGQKLSLFYAPFVPYDLALSLTHNGVCLPGDHVAFLRRAVAQEQLARESIGPLFSEGQHELHLHVHHEFWTRNDSHFSKPVSQWVNANSTAEMDTQRLDLFFRLCKEVIAREVGRPLQRWAFVHGNWALAASDPLICKVESELELIMKHGGFGDFSFPAGRAYCDPRLEMPFTCLPVKGVRPYDDAASDFLPVAPGTRGLRPGRFFIWNSPIKAIYSSLDYYTPYNRDLFRDPARVLIQWLENSVVLGDSLFIKTHAHSMKWEYEIGNPDSHIPHCYPDVVSLFEGLLRACDRASVDIQFSTVNEIMDILARYQASEVAGNGTSDGLVRAAWNVDDALATVDNAGGGVLSSFPSVAARGDVPSPDVPSVLLPADGPGSARAPAPAPITFPEGARVVYRSESSREKSSVPVDGGSFAREFLACQEAWNAGEGASQPPDDLFSFKSTRGIALETYESAIAEKILERYRADTPVLEIGSGYGALALFLGLNGYSVLGYDGDRRRSAAASWHVARFVESHPGLADRIGIIGGYFPAASHLSGDSAVGRRFLAIATNITCTYTKTNQEQIFDVLARHCDEVILDLARFGVNRNSQTERDELRAELEARGFRAVEKLYAANPYEYWRFRTGAGIEKEALDFLFESEGDVAPAPPGSEHPAPEVRPVSVQPVVQSTDAVFPITTADRRVLYALHGDRRLEACPVCNGADFVQLWRMPMAGTTLQVPAELRCFDFCHDCESIFLNPVRSARKAAHRGADDHIRAMAAKAAWQRYEETFDDLAAWIPSGARTMVDAACGIGPYLQIARRREPKRWQRLIGLELSATYVEHMRGRDLEAHAVDIDAHDLRMLLGKGSIDFITFCEAFEHVERPLAALAKLLALLKPGGRLYFTAPRYGSDVQAAVRPDEPIYIGEKVLTELPRRLDCKVVNVSTSALRYGVVLEK